jgi:hypothetical protein
MRQKRSRIIGLEFKRKDYAASFVVVPAFRIVLTLFVSFRVSYQNRTLDLERLMELFLRRRRDSNSWYHYWYTRFPGEPIRPLWHLSGGFVCARIYVHGLCAEFLHKQEHQYIVFFWLTKGKYKICLRTHKKMVMFTCLTTLTFLMLTFSLHLKN